jgi:cellulose synthase/poly-beta-1,6-N-acetylglucosamine synthase-like glycosyltransferase
MSNTPSHKAELPFVTLAIPCKNEERYIERTVRCALAQDYPVDRLEVLVADGVSTDRTRAILAEIGQADRRLRVLENPDRIQAAGMNVMIRQARGNVVIRLDAHADYAADYVRRCVEVLERTGADNVGGAQRARAASWFQRAFCAAMSSPLGGGGAAYKSADAEGFVDTVYCGAFRRSVFETVGMFDARAITNEDAELNQRIAAAGGRIYLSRDIVAHYYPRDSFRAVARQYFAYGKGRARTVLKHGRFLTLRPLASLGAVLGGVVLVATWPLHHLTVPVFALYALLCLAEAVRVGVRSKIWSIPAIAALFPVMHAAHGIGMIWGFVHYWRHPDWKEPERLEPVVS